MDKNWVPCRDKDTKYCYWVKETRKDDAYELIFSLYPQHEKGWEHGGIKFVAKTLKGFLNSRYYKKYQFELLLPDSANQN